MKKITATLLILLVATLAHAAQTSSQWEKFTSPAGRFAVLLPGKPEENKKTQNSPHGPYTVHLFTAQGDGEIFLVGWVDYDPGFRFDTQKELEANRDNFAKGVEATVLDTVPINLGAHPGIEFTAESAQAFFRSRVFIVGRRPYQLVAVRLKNAQDSPNVNRFFSSFEVSSAG